MSTRAAALLAITLWLLLVSAALGWYAHWRTHRPCADVDGKPAEIAGIKGCLEEPHGR